jgi:hypothetical protein
MVEIIRKMFEGKPEKSTIAIKGCCSDCGCKTAIEVTATPGGFGLMGGVLFKGSPDEYCMRCQACHSKTDRYNIITTGGSDPPDE